MSVYRPRRPDGKRQAEYIYDFRCRNRRFSGPTGETDRRHAEAIEKKRREAVKAAAQRPGGALTFGDAAGRYWIEVGKFHRNAADTERSIAWLMAKIGRHSKLTVITNARVAELVAIRRADGVSNATVNRQVIEPLRGILRRAAEVWDQKVARIEWKRHALAEKRVHVREASAAEEESLYAAMRPDYRRVIGFAFLAGCRLAEICGLRWADVDFFNRELTVTGKGDRKRTIPMSRPILDLLWSLKDDHPECVFTYAAEKTRDLADGRRIERGRRYPVTYSGLKSEWRRGRARSGVTNFRFHDMRHTAASRVARATGDLRIVRDLLGHQEIATTMRYAHLTREDLRAGLEAAHAAVSTDSAMKNAKFMPVDSGKALIQKGK